MKLSAGKITESFADFLMPRRCAVCGKLLARREDLLCSHCMMELPRTGSLNVSDDEIYRKVMGRREIRTAVAWLSYQPGSRLAKMIQEAKYNGYWKYARRLGELMGEELLEASRHAKSRLADSRPDKAPDTNVIDPLDGIDLLLPVPLHWRKRTRRGYNQSLEIARGISAATGIPVGHNLVAIKGHGSQTRKSDLKRAENVRGIFAVRHPERLNGLNVAVVDDILTTGATLREASQTVLEGASPASVSVFALAMAVKN